MKLRDLEVKFDFKYPILFKQMEEDGMFNIGAYGAMWYSTVFPLIKDNPTLLLHSDDYELLPIEQMEEEIAWFRDPDNYMEIKEEYVFIPFAQNGAGDKYCFFVSAQKEDDIPIVFVWHDDNEVIWEAKNIQDFVFKRILQDMTRVDTYNKQSEEEFKNNLVVTLKTHSRYLTQDKVALLERLTQRDIVVYESYGEVCKGFITEKEYEELLKEYVPYELMNTTFPYSD
ncbi:MAG: SMI1/KNR4 family protein [Flavobacteriaceae bacterium]|jgi:hypothetical protein|nr:SMI1/KNR4 family protein [Flavobacteriaceae bacterium]